MSRWISYQIGPNNTVLQGYSSISSHAYVISVSILRGLEKRKSRQLEARSGEPVYKRADLTSIRVITQYSCIGTIADLDWEHPQIDLTSEKTLHPWTLQAGSTVLIHSVFFIRATVKYSLVWLLIFA